MKEGKRRLNTVISEAVYKDFMAFIQQRCGYYKKGDLSKWTEIAFRGLMANSNQQQQSTKNMQKHQKQVIRVAKTWQTVSKYIMDKNGFELQVGKTIPTKMLEGAISFSCGHDGRTVRNWINNFTGHEYIEPITPFAFNVKKTGFVIPVYNKQELR